ncbi:tetratricopeptide repeat protein [Pseudonocardia sp. DLS-67]
MPFWRKKSKSTDHHVGEFGSAEIDVTDRRGEPPLIDVTLSLTPEYAHRLDFQHKRDELGLHHLETLHALHRYGVALGNLPDRRDEAVELLGWLVDARADDQENRLLALNDLTRLLQDGGNLALAEQRLREGLSGWERLRGRDDARTLAIAANLAKVLLDLGRRDEAEPLMRDTVDRSTRVLGAAHPDTLGSRNVLAGALRGSPARLAEAERMYLALLDDIESAAGDTDDLAMVVRHNLAAVLTHQGKGTEALEMNRVLVEARSRQLGDDHPDTLVSRHNHAVVLNSLGHATEAETLLARVLDDYRRVHGPRHAATLGVQVDLAALRANQGRNAEAVPLLSDAIEGYRSTHGPDHPLVHELSTVLAQLGG